ncbi:MAG: phosphatase PAP2 family protein [Candidatus Polarisedimenticolaceae bacterium]|nr:phosphatase PAP2 family protein [Candidatus Polarisedimenticolaceae bacterium]
MQTSNPLHLFGIPVYFWLIVALFSGLFILFPEIDLNVTALFYRDGFYLEHHPFNDAIYTWAPKIINFFVLTLLVGILYCHFKKCDTFFNIRKVALLYLFTAILVGPGIVVNLVLKEFVDRPRPRHVEQFGGSKSFVPALIISDQCQSNCSFVSGHAAGGFSLIALAFLFHGRRRHLIFAAAVVTGGIIGLVRMMQGGHFLSDVIFAFLVTYLTTKIIYYLFFEREPHVRIRSTSNQS